MMMMIGFLPLPQYLKLGSTKMEPGSLKERKQSTPKENKKKKKRKVLR